MGVGMRIRCLKCKDVIQSEWEGQWVACTCGAVWVDALVEGQGRTRIGGNREDYEQVPDEA